MPYHHCCYDNWGGRKCAYNYESCICWCSTEQRRAAPSSVGEEKHLTYFSPHYQNFLSLVANKTRSSSSISN